MCPLTRSRADRQRAERPDGGVLRAARLRRPDHHRRHVAVAERPRLRPHPRHLFRRAGRRLEEGHRRRARPRRQDLRAVDAHRPDRPSAQPAGRREDAWRPRPSRPPARCGPTRRHEAASGARRDDRGGTQEHDRGIRARPRRTRWPPASTASNCTPRTATCSNSSSGRTPTSAPTPMAARSRIARVSCWRSPEASIAAIGKDKVGIRLSPYGVFNDMPLYPEMEPDYAYLAAEAERGRPGLCPPGGSFGGRRAAGAGIDQGRRSAARSSAR